MQRKEPDYVKYAYKINEKTIKELEKEKNLYCYGTGGGMMTCIEEMHLAFQFFGEISLDEKRELIVFAIDRYLQNINSHEKIRPFLIKYPFTSKQLDILIIFLNSDGSAVPREEISSVSSRNGILKFSNHDEEGYLNLALKETYEEAKQKISNN